MIRFFWLLTPLVQCGANHYLSRSNDPEWLSMRTHLREHRRTAP